MRLACLARPFLRRFSAVFRRPFAVSPRFPATTHQGRDYGRKTEKNEGKMSEIRPKMLAGFSSSRVACLSPRAALAHHQRWLLCAATNSSGGGGYGGGCCGGCCGCCRCCCSTPATAAAVVAAAAAAGCALTLAPLPCLARLFVGVFGRGLPTGQQRGAGGWGAAVLGGFPLIFSPFFPVGTIAIKL